jgi:hypothetical protein
MSVRNSGRQPFGYGDGDGVRRARQHNALVLNQTSSDYWQHLAEMPPKSWWARLPFGVRMTVGACALLMVIGSGVAGISAMVQGEPRAVRAAARESSVAQRQGGAMAGQAAAGAAPAPVAPAPPAEPGSGAHVTGERMDMSRVSDEADRTATRAPRRAPGDGEATGAPRAVAPVVVTRTVSETRAVPFRTTLVRDRSLPRGSRRVRTPGVPGEETVRYLVTYTSGEETGRRLLDTTVTKEPQQQVVAFGTRRGKDHPHDRQGCDPDRETACVPIARRALCPDDSGDATVDAGGPAAEESAGDDVPPAADGEAADPAGEEVYLINPADLTDLELDPAVLCD